MPIKSKISTAALIALLGMTTPIAESRTWAQENVPTAKNAPIRYRLRDGSIAIFGNDGMEAMLTRFNALMAKRRPGTRFNMTLNGSSTGLPALSAGATLLAPLARDAWKGELGPFRQVHGYDASPIRIGYSGWGPRSNGKTPAAVYVNRNNPLKTITLADLERVFTVGSKDGDVSLWSQLGVTGEAGGRQIHIYGLGDDGGSATAFRLRNLHGQAYAARYEPLDSNQAIIRAVAADSYGIGITGWVDAQKVSDQVRIVAVDGADGKPASPSRADVAAGRYPLSLPVQFYVDKAPNGPLDPLVKAYVEAALSDAGQAIIAQESDGPDGYLPLSAADLAVERAKLSKM